MASSVVVNCGVCCRAGRDEKKKGARSQSFSSKEKTNPRIKPLAQAIFNSAKECWIRRAEKTNSVGSHNTGKKKKDYDRVFRFARAWGSTGRRQAKTREGREASQTRAHRKKTIRQKKRRTERPPFFRKLLQQESGFWATGKLGNSKTQGSTGNDRRRRRQ